MIFKRFSTLTLTLALGLSSIHAEPLPDSAAAAPTAVPAQAPMAAPASGTLGSPAVGASGKEPMIEVSVDTLEIGEKNAEQLGLNWQTALGGGSGQGLNFMERSIPSIFNAGTFDRITQLQATLSALINNQQARVLANPTLLTKSSFEATFSVGGEIPYATAGQGGVQGVEFKKYGVILKILPVITPRHTIDAQINVTVSNPDNTNSIQLNGNTVPSIASRDAGSKVEVLDGETVVLAGIKQSTRNKTIIKVPFLGSIPLLGLLFRYKDESVTQNSLVIFVTFRLIK
jgi:pilus assembly protein CpaC